MGGISPKMPRRKYLTNSHVSVVGTGLVVLARHALVVLKQSRRHPT